MTVAKTEEYTAVGGATVTAGEKLEPMARALWIGGAGNVSVLGPDGTTVTYTNVPVGQLNVQAVMVVASGTTATSIVAMH